MTSTICQLQLQLHKAEPEKNRYTDCRLLYIYFFHDKMTNDYIAIHYNNIALCMHYMMTRDKKGRAVLI